MELNEKIIRLQGKSFDNMEYRLKILIPAVINLRDEFYVASGVTKNESTVLLWK